MSKIKVLAVNDPAVLAYTDEKFRILEKFKDEVDFDIVDFECYYQNMMDVFEGRKEYDIVMVAGHLWLADFVNKGYLEKVHPDKNKQYHYMDIIKSIREEISIEGSTYLYPSFCDGHILLYRKSVIKEILGRDTLDKVVSTDDIINLAKLCNGHKGMSGIALKAHKSEIFLDFLPYLRNEGIDAFVLDNFESTVQNTNEGKRALEKYKSLREFAPDDTHSYANNEIRDCIQNKKSVLAVTWGGQLGMVLSKDCKDIEDIGFSAIKTSWNVTWSFAISKNSKNKSRAEDFLQYLTSKEVDKIVGAYSGSPVRKSTYDNDNGEHKWYEIHQDIIENLAKPLPKMENSGEKFSILYDYIYDYFTK